MPTSVHADGNLSLTIENYLACSANSARANSLTNGTSLATRYVSAEDHISDKITLVGAELKSGGYDLLDENYAKVDALGGTWRVGRFRTAFGLSDWGEYYYMGLPAAPLVRAYYDANDYGLTLNRIDTGADYVTSIGNWQYQLGFVDINSDKYQLGPRHLDHYAGRAQTYLDGWILGVSALGGTTNVAGVHEYTRAFDLDWRWSAPSIIIRGEAIDAIDTGIRTDGYYLDFSYHSLKLPMTTWLARVETVKYTGTGDSPKNAVTFGVRQHVNRYLSLELAQEFSNDSDVGSSYQGTTLQIVTAATL